MKPIIKPNNEFEYVAQCGEHIKTAITRSCQIAQDKNKNVFFDFNGKRISVTPLSNVEDVLKQYEEESELRRKEYEASAEYKKIERSRIKSVEKNQKIVDGSLSLLFGNKVTTLDGLVLWLKDFIEPADNIGVVYDHSAIIKWFSDNGYVSNFGVGKPSDFFDNRNNLGRYLIGQAISCFEIGMGPHPVMYKFVERYFNIPVEKSIEKLTKKKF